MRILVLMFSLTAIVLAGCSHDEGLTEVRGKLYIGDQLSQKGVGSVTFHPDSSKGNNWMEEAVGHVQPDGTFELEARGKKGAAKGWYKVGVTVAEVIDPNNPYVTKWLMPNPDKFRAWNQSGISVEVVDEPNEGQYDIRLPALSGAGK